MKIAPRFLVFLSLGLLSLSVRAALRPDVQSLGPNTYSITCQAGSGFSRDTEKLKAEALDRAAAYCASLHKELKVLSATANKPKIMFTGYASAKVVFQALDASDPELHAPVAPTAATTAANAPATAAGPMPEAAPAPHSPTDTLYSDLMKLDELRKRGILTDEEFQAQKKKVLDRSN